MSTLSIRLPNSIHQHTKLLAREEGISINQFVASAVAEKLSALDTERYLSERAARGKKVNVARILAKVPKDPPAAEAPRRSRNAPAGARGARAFDVKPGSEDGLLPPSRSWTPAGML